jgi:serine/threonine protein kinase, bacterial
MKHKGPILTLAAGLVLAAVLMVLNLRVTSGQQRDAAGEPAPEAPAATATSAPADAAPPTTPPAEAPAAAPATYAGKVTGGAATIAIAVKGDKAVAYLCDGNRVEAWLQGSARNGELVLKGSGNARLSGTFDQKSAEGNVNAAGRRFTFAVRLVKPPSGLYRAAANVTNAEIVEGWIVLENGDVTGTMTRNGVTGPGTPLKLPEATTVVDGTTITASQVDPGAGL